MADEMTAVAAQPAPALNGTDSPAEQVFQAPPTSASSNDVDNLLAQAALENKDIDLKTVTLRVVIKDKQRKKARLGDLKVDKTDPKKPRLVIDWTLLEPALDTNDQPIPAGHKGKDSILLYETGGYTSAMKLRKLAQLQVAALGLKEPDASIPYSRCVGKDVMLYAQAKLGEDGKWQNNFSYDPVDAGGSKGGGAAVAQAPAAFL